MERGHLHLYEGMALPGENGAAPAQHWGYLAGSLKG